MFNRFAICEAYYWYFTLYHGGQWSDEYRRLSKLTGYFRPGLCSSFGKLDDDQKQAVESIRIAKGQKESCL